VDDRNGIMKTWDEIVLRFEAPAPPGGGPLQHTRLVTPGAGRDTLSPGGAR
jgi:hypothetical protein